jgi:hypothetical protein
VGEERLAGWLDANQGDPFLTLHDRRLPHSKANIDHLVIAATGIWVIDAKRYKGVVEKRDVGEWLRSDLRLYVGDRDRSRLVTGMRKQIEHVRGSLEQQAVPVPDVHGVLCFIDADWRLFAKPFLIDGVLVTWPRGLRKALLAQGPCDATRRQAILRYLAVSFPPAS